MLLRRTAISSDLFHFSPLSPKNVSPPRGFLNICVAAYLIPAGFNEADQSHHSPANHQPNSTGGEEVSERADTKTLLLDNYELSI